MGILTLGKNMNKIQYNKFLLKTRRIMIWDDITPKMSYSVVSKLKLLSYHDINKPLYIYIHSDGGDTHAEGAIIDEMNMIKANGGTIYTICQGKAMSAAADILCMGSTGRRFATPSSTIMFHLASTPFENDNLETHKGALEFWIKQQDEMTKTLAKICRKDTPKKFKQFVDDLKKTLYLTAKEAKQYGVIDGIWTSDMETEVYLKGNDNV